MGMGEVMSDLRGMISIIVSVYNVRPYLRKCLDSIRVQTYPNLEIIMVDDGSNDGSSGICEEFVRKDTRFRVIHKRNEGLVQARKDGVLLANGDFVGYVDGDDWIEPNMYEVLFRNMLDSGADISMCGRFDDVYDTSFTVRHGIKAGKYTRRQLVESVYPTMIVNRHFFEWGIFPGVWDKLFRKENILNAQLAVDPRIRMGEDAACTYPLLLQSNCIYISDECLYHYRQTSSSMVKRSDPFDRIRMQILYRTVADKLFVNREVFDLTDQWKKYVLFLLIPRAFSCYEGIEKLEYLFPFPHVKRGMRIALYGMGTYGQRMYSWLIETGFCEVVRCFDRNFEALRKLGVEANDPNSLAECDADAILITNTYFFSRMKLFSELTDLYPDKTIYTIDENEVLSLRTLKAFGIELAI